MNYMVMECHPSYAVLLDEEGRFLKAANLHYKTGQIVHDPVLMQEEPAKQRNLMRWARSGMAAAAACFLLLIGFNYYQNNVVSYSSIYLTINPEIQMDLNRKGSVTRLEGINEDGKTLLEGYDGKGKDKITVTDELIDRAIEIGFLSEGGRVSFSIDSPDEALFQEYGTELRTKVTEHLDGRITITIEIMNHQDGQGQESPENSSSSTPSQPSTSQPELTSPSSSEPSHPVVVPPTSSNATDYDDTDYGPNNDGVTDYTPPASSSPVYTDTDYGPGNDGDTGYTPPSASTPPVDTDYGPGSDGVTDYTNGDTDYDPDNNDDDNDNDDNDGDSGYDDDDSDDDSDDDNDPDDDD